MRETSRSKKSVLEMVEAMVRSAANGLGLHGLVGNSRAVAQFVLFGVVGVSNTLVAYITFLVALELLGDGAHASNLEMLESQAISFFISVAWSFMLNNRFVFEAKDNNGLLRRLAKTYISYSLTGLFLSSALLVLWVRVLNVPETIAPLINLLFTVPMNFLLNKYWAFRGSSRAGGSKQQ